MTHVPLISTTVKWNDIVVWYKMLKLMQLIRWILLCCITKPQLLKTIRLNCFGQQHLHKIHLILSWPQCAAFISVGADKITGSSEVENTQIVSGVWFVFMHLTVFVLLPPKRHDLNNQCAGAQMHKIHAYWSGSAGPDTHLCSTSSKHESCFHETPDVCEPDSFLIHLESCKLPLGDK